MKLKALHIALIVLLTVFGGIGLSAVNGVWKTTNDKIPAVYTSGEAMGQFNPADIKGSYTFDDIQKSFGVPAADLAVAFGIPDPTNAGAFQCKELEALYAAQAAAGNEIGTGSVRYFVALYKNLPYEAEEAIYLPASAVKLLQEKVLVSQETLAYLSTVTVDTQGPSGEAPRTAPAVESAAVPLSIRGSTTFQELLDAGLTSSEIEAVIGMPMPEPGQIIRGVAAEKGVEFSEWKDALQEILNRQ